jgi:hypothetical protein
MTQSLQDIMGSRVPKEPPEVVIIKQFVHETFAVDCGVAVQQQQIIIQVRGAALAGALRPYLGDIKTACATDKRLIIRIS